VNAFELFGHWTSVRKGLYQALDLLADEQLDFVPREGLWSLGHVARHIANAEEGWFRHIVTGELEEWPRDYTAADYPTVDAVKLLLQEVHSRTATYLKGVTAADVDQRIQLSWGPEVTLRWVIWHVLEHEIHHRGEIYLMIGLMGMEAPDV
jgi:uncharacterized damage-inducible protein DinB